MARLVVDSEKDLRLESPYFAVQGEETVVTVETEQLTDELTYDAYVDFLTPDGKAVWRGEFDASIGAFQFTLESDDDIINVDGNLIIQIVFAITNVDGTRDIKWCSKQCKTKILSSVSAE